MTNSNVTFSTTNTPVKNECSPSNIFGGFEQTLFLGCSVQSFSASGGWNSQTGSLTVRLVEDNCEADPALPKFYWDSNLYKQSTTAADPGFLGLTKDIIGCPVYFRVADFEYAGIIQSWEQTNNPGGNPTYTVQITDPRLILENTQLIIGDYAGTVANAYNLFNVYGYMESFGILCPQLSQTTQGAYNFGDLFPDGAVFGSPADGYGGANTNDNGMQWHSIRTALNVLANRIPRASNTWSPYGRVMYRGVQSGNYGLMSADSLDFSEYFLDLSELPVAPTYFRFSGTSISVMDLINELTEASGHDYYIELLPIRDSFSAVVGSGIAKLIKVRTVSRFRQPALNEIQKFIDNNNNSAVSYNKGQELRNEPLSSFVIGGAKNTIYQAYQSFDPEGDGTNRISQGSLFDTGCNEIDDTILPFFGLDSNKDFIVACKDADGFWYFDIEIDILNQGFKVLELISPTADGKITISLKDLYLAANGTDLFYALNKAADEQGSPTILYTALVSAAGVLGFALPEGAFVEGALNILKKWFDGRGQNGNQILGIDALNPKGANLKDVQDEVGAEIFDDVERLLAKLVEYYNQLGRQFAVRVPFTCVQLDGESIQVIPSETPKADGWTEFPTPGAVDVLGLREPQLSFFRNETNKIEALVYYQDNGDKSLFYSDRMPYDAWLRNSDDTGMYVRASAVSEDFVYHDHSTFFGPRVVIEVPAVTYEKSDSKYSVEGFQNAIKLLFGTEEGDKLNEIWKKPDSLEVTKKVIALPKMIDGAAFGIESTVLTYGPWANLGPPGQTNVSTNANIVPWNYGSYAVMNLAGQAQADEAITNMQVGEKGFISVPGYPTVPLGAELGALAGGFFGGGHHLVENRSLSTDVVLTNSYGFFQYTDKWSGIYGPNITSVTTSIGPEGLRTEYQFNTFTPKFGRFSKANSRRLEQLGVNAASAVRRENIFRLGGSSVRFIRPTSFGDWATTTSLDIRSDIIPARTPHSVLTGSVHDWDSTEDSDDKAFTRPRVQDMSIKDINYYMGNDDTYSSMAMMSLDGLLRPVSMDGDGELPRYITPLGACENGGERGPVETLPPVQDDQGGDVVHALKESQNYLNPFSNPPGKARAQIHDQEEGESKVGHDIEMVARGDTSPEGGLMMPLAGYSEESAADYEDDYRFMALRGPLVMQSWGYDLAGKPVPNEADVEEDTKQGTFVETELKDNFMKDFLRKSETWPVAPVDLRLDRERGVWVAAPNKFRFLKANLLGNLTSSTTSIDAAVDDESSTWYDEDGNEVSNPVITINNGLGHVLPSGYPVYCEYDPAECNYNIVETPPTNLLPLFPFSSGQDLGQLLPSGQAQNHVGRAPSAGIAARVADGQPTGGQIQVHMHDGTNLVPVEPPVFAYNLTNESISAFAWTLIHRDLTGTWYIGFEDCTCP